MTRVLVVLLAVFCAFSSVSAGAPASQDELLADLRSAVKAGDKSAILSLFNWQGVSPDMRSFAEQWAGGILGQKVAGIAFVPPPNDFRPSFEEGGLRYTANVSVLGFIEIKTTPPDQHVMPMPYGKLGNAFYIAGTMREKIPSTQPLAPGTKTITIQVRTSGGDPLPDTIVVCADPRSIPILQFKTLFGGREQFITDARGQFSLPLVTPDLYLVAATESGFGVLSNADLKDSAVLTLNPWCRINGHRANRGYPVTDEHLSLTPDRDFYRDQVFAPVRLIIKETTTDAQGHFAFDNLPPLKFFIIRQEKQRTYWGYFWSVDLSAGQSPRLDISTRGRTVIGHLKRSPDLDPTIDLSACSAALLSNLKDREGSRRSVGFPVSADGSFLADHVEPGDYKITGDIWRGDDHLAVVDSVPVHIPDDTSDAVDVPFDMGTVDLNPAVLLKPGAAAPDFVVTTLDGKSLKLSDFHGKYVLLDFWATWCGPCVAETPNLKSTYDAFGHDPRFTILSLSLDQDRTAPRKLVQTRNIPWQQAFLGEWSADKVTKTYGVYAIPAIFLIGPDGKIVATDLRGAKIKTAVAKVLGSS